MSELRSIPISRIAVRSNLFMGGDRELVMMSIIIAAILIFVPQDLFTAICGVGLWLGSIFILRQMAKKDPLMRHAGLRYLKKYRQAYYAPRSTPFCEV